MKKVRIETFTGQVSSIPLKAAIVIYGKHELLEYLQGHNSEELFFLMDEDHNDIYPVTIESIS